MELRVLGPLELVGRDGPVRVRAAKQRQLLIGLVVAGGRPAPFDRLIDALWNGRPPASAENLLRVYVSQVRKLLPSPARIVTREGAYQLELPVAALDSHRFESLLADGRRAAEAGNLVLASSLLRRATALWYGRALDEGCDDDFVRLEAARLEELRLVALEELFECELGLGRAAAILGELVAAARSVYLCLVDMPIHRLNESFDRPANPEPPARPALWLSWVRVRRAGVCRRSPSIRPRGSRES